MAGDIPDVYLRFQDPNQDFTGECNDSKHPGAEGWITVKSFSFGFGFQGADGSPSDEEEDSTAQPTPGTPGSQKPNKAAEKTKTKRKKKTAAMKSGPMSFDCISFTKASDAMSASLMDACHSGQKIETVELHACRYGGGPKNEKTPFLILVFKDVCLKTCKLNLATEGLPSEDVEFEYDKVEMKCMWTDNATGDPLDEQPITAGWDFKAQKRLDNLLAGDNDSDDEDDDDDDDDDGDGN